MPGFVNFMRGFVFGDAQSNNNPDIASSFAPNYREEMALADTPDALVDNLNVVLAAGRLRPATIKNISDLISTIPLKSPQLSSDDARQLRVMHAVLMVMTTSEYTVQF